MLAATACQKDASHNMPGMMAMQVPVRAVQAETRDVPLTVSAVGTVEAFSTVDVKSRVAGQILKVDFQEGQNVEKGQLLFEIDPEPLERQIVELKANIAKDDALDAQAKANVVRDQAQVKQAKAAADRGLALAKDGIYSKEQTEQVVETADAANASLQADQAAIESAEASKKADQAKLGETELQLQYTKITAPISGRAGVVSVEAGNLIKDNDASLVTLLEISPIYISFGVPEQMLDQIKTEQARRPLEVVADVNGTKEIGRVRFIDNSVDATTGMVKLKAEFANVHKLLWPGQFVNVTAQLDVEHGRVLVPSESVETGPGGKYVWVVDRANDSVSMRPVKILRLIKSGAGPEQAVVGSGLQAGDLVISEGQLRLAPGVKVRLLNQAAPPTAETESQGQ